MTPLLTYLHSLVGLSFVAVGGANAVLPELHEVTVVQHHWLTSQDFAQLFAISQAAPGPNVLVVAALGWKIGGIGGALASVVAMCGPSSVLAYVVSRVWTRFENARPRIVLAAVLAPIAVGLVLGSGVAVAQTVGPTLAGVAFCISASLVSWRTNLSPLYVLAAGAAIGATGLL